MHSIPAPQPPSASCGLPLSTPGPGICQVFCPQGSPFPECHLNAVQSPPRLTSFSCVMCLRSSALSHRPVICSFLLFVVFCHMPVHSPVKGHLNCFQLVLESHDQLGTGFCESMRWYTLGKHLGETLPGLMDNFMRSCLTVLQSGCTVLHTRGHVWRLLWLHVHVLVSTQGFWSVLFVS